MNRSCLLLQLLVALPLGLVDCAIGAQTPGLARPLNEGAFDAPVTVRAVGEPIEKLLKRLNVEGRPQLAAEKEVGWERVTIVARGKALREVLLGLATLLHYEWSREEKPEFPSGYRWLLAPSAAVKSREKELHRQTVERNAAPLFRLVEMLNIPEEKRAALEKRMWKQEDLGDPL